MQPAPGSITKRKRKGRGNASGTGGESGRGHKGQKSRAGFSQMRGFEGGQMPLYRRLPKKRGLGNRSFQIKPEIINLSKIDEFFTEKDKVTPETLVKRGLISKGSKVKVLGAGKLTKAINIAAHSFSKSALKGIEKANAKAEVVK